jgi:hypothetical protein
MAKAKKETAASIQAKKLEDVLTDREAVRDDPDKTKFVQDLRRQLGEALAAGAVRCENCGHDVVGILKTPAHMNRGVEVPPLYEVGCVICPPYYIEDENGTDAELDGKKTKVMRISYSARSYGSPEAAVEKWNKGEFVKDYNFGLNVPPHEHARLKLPK